MTRIDEIAADIFRISTYVPEFDLQFNQFLVRDQQPLLFETGMKQMFPIVREAVSKVLDPSSLRYVSFSHFEPDECGSLNEWLTIAPQAEAVCSVVGAMVFVNDAAVRPARGLANDAIVETGKYRFRFKSTPHLPHGWDAGVLFEETKKTLFCSDLFHHFGQPEPITTSDLIGPTRTAMKRLQQGPLSGYMPYMRQTAGVLRSLAELKPEVLAVMHGSSYRGTCDKLLTDLAGVIKEEFDKETYG